MCSVYKNKINSFSIYTDRKIKLRRSQMEKQFIENVLGHGHPSTIKLISTEHNNKIICTYLAV